MVITDLPVTIPSFDACAVLQRNWYIWMGGRVPRTGPHRHSWSHAQGGDRERQRIREIMTDDRHELSTCELHNICEGDRIKLHTTGPYHPASNGAAGRTIGLLSNAVCAMLTTWACRAPLGRKPSAQQRTFAIGCRRGL